MIDRTSHVPLYIQLKEIIKKQIETNNLQPGEAIPSERELSEKYKLSRMTIRQAINDLVNEGILVKEHGRGTFVAKKKIEKGLPELRSFSEDMIDRGLKPGAKVLEFKLIEPNNTVISKLKLQESQLVYHIKRIRYADGEPMAFENVYITASRCPGLDKYNLQNNSLYEILKQDYEIKFNYAEQSLRVKRLSKEEAESLNLKKITPVCSLYVLYMI